MTEEYKYFKPFFTRSRSKVKQWEKRLASLKGNKVPAVGAKSYREDEEGQKIIKTVRGLRRKPKTKKIPSESELRNPPKRMTYDEIAVEMNRRGIKSLQGLPWSGTLIAKILKRKGNKNKAKKNVEQQIKKLEKIIDNDLTLEYLKGMWDYQNGYCAISGLKMEMDITRESPSKASLDRIDSSKGYVSGNVQWVCLFVNYAKSDFEDEPIKKLFKLINRDGEKRIK